MPKSASASASGAEGVECVEGGGGCGGVCGAIRASAVPCTNTVTLRYDCCTPKILLHTKQTLSHHRRSSLFTSLQRLTVTAGPACAASAATAHVSYHPARWEPTMARGRTARRYLLHYAGRCRAAPQLVLGCATNKRRNPVRSGAHRAPDPQLRQTRAVSASGAKARAPDYRPRGLRRTCALGGASQAGIQSTQTAANRRRDSHHRRVRSSL